MKKAALFAVVAVLLAISLPAFAQEFPDVPPDHWAYDAVQELVNVGIIQGYPDGTFGGKRAMSRYEFAEATAKLLPWVEEKIKAMQAGPGGVGAPGAPGAPGASGAGAEELAAIRKLIDEFRDELAALGVDVEALRRDVAALNERVTALEEEVARVRLTGEANMIARGEVNLTDLEEAPTSGIPFDRDSRRLAEGSLGTPDQNNPLANSAFFTDLDFGMKARVSEDASVNALINAGDYLGFALDPDGLGPLTAGLDDFTLWNLYFDGAIKLGPLGAAQVVVGRYSFQLTPLTMKLVDPDSYTNVTKLDSGDFVLDGGRASFNFGKVALTAFAGKAEPIADLISPDLMMPGASSAVNVSQVGGARAVIGAGSIGNVGLTYYQAGVGAGRSTIMGADVNATFGGLGVAAEYAQSEPNDSLLAASGPDMDIGNMAWNAKLNYNVGALAIGGGFTRVNRNYAAPGYWSRLGRAVNLTNVEGPVANVSYALGSNISLTAEGQFLQPFDSTGVHGRTAIDSGRIISQFGLDKITAWKAGLKYGLTSANAVDLGWEQVTWAPDAGDNTTENYISIGLGHSFNPNASLKLLYQIVEYSQGAPNPYAVGADGHGGVATAQFQLKY